MTTRLFARSATNSAFAATQHDRGKLSRPAETPVEVDVKLTWPSTKFAPSPTPVGTVFQHMIRWFEVSATKKLPLPTCPPGNASPTWFGLPGPAPALAVALVALF